MDNGVRILKDSSEKIPIDENFKLIAGPGAGKTTFLVNHINYVIKESDKLKNGRKILCITFTNVAVDTIKERLSDFINEVEVTTIHSFLFSHVLKPYLWVIIDEINHNLLDLSTVKESYPSFSLLPNNRELYLIKNSFPLSLIYSQLKRFYWGLEDGIIRPKCNFPINFSNDFLIEYKNKLWDKGRITPDDILYFSFKILSKEPKILDILRIKFPYIFIDEFQDVCNVQKAIIEMLCSKHVVVGIIGDPAQSIYSFRGAEYGNLNDVQLDLKEYMIQVNRRSNDKIVNMLNNLRTDLLIQVPLKKSEFMPTILIGNEINAYGYVGELIEDKSLHVLAYKHEYLNDVQLKLDSDCQLSLNKNYLIDLENYGDKRESIIKSTIHAIENFREINIKAALRHITFAFRNLESDESILIKKLFELAYEYSNFKNMNLKDFFNTYIHPNYEDKLPRITGGDINEIYSNISYNDIVRNINHTKNSLFRTIHSCKGAEFNNVLIISKYKNLNYLFNFDMANVNHRVYYVAMSRAKERLFISTDYLPKKMYGELRRIGFNVKRLEGE